ncbi:MAG: hypothetical protein H0W78_07340 [Planctomycetes bacterium]|nr:hypothetical protein [Planctomycetota bacterium]
MIRFLVKTVIIVAVVVFVLPFVAIVGLGLFTGAKDSAADGGGDPGKVIYDDMNRMIGSYNGVDGFGNTPEARAIAQRFAMAMKEIRSEAFTKGKDGAVSLSQGHFITYCHGDDKSFVLLCHVPEFRRFQDDAKAALMGIAWNVAQSATATPDEKPRTLVIGLRGVALYYQFWSGTTTGKPAQKLDSSDGKKVVYRVLAPPARPAPVTAPPAATPAPASEPVPTAVEAKPTGWRLHLRPAVG